MLSRDRECADPAERDQTESDRASRLPTADSARTSTCLWSSTLMRGAVCDRTATLTERVAGV